MKVLVKFAKSDKLLLSKNVHLDNYTFHDVVTDVSSKLGIKRDRIGLKTSKNGKVLRVPDNTSINSIPFSEPDCVSLYFVDFGPQLGYRTVYVLEYLAALLPYFVLYLRWEKHNARPQLHTRLAAVCWVCHFLKRILESLFLHKFSRDTMPVYSAYRNVAYYGGFSVLVGYFVNQADIIRSAFSSLVFGALFFVCVYCNYTCHALLASLRTKDSDQARPLPRPNEQAPTLLYNLVSFPNYTYEILTWVCFTLLTCTWSAALFTCAGAATMTIWALQKHGTYVKRPDYPKNLRAIIPFIL